MGWCVVMRSINSLRILFVIFFSIGLIGRHGVSPEIFHEPIDIVYTWVDGNDPAWQAIKESYLAAAIKKNRSVAWSKSWAKMVVLLDGATQNRFVDNDELRYSLRSVFKYAPFVNHIYIITMNQRPAWLASHPKITIIDHTQIFKNQDDLPTFNSHALESNLHRIPGLSEYFIYFNDDVFLGAPVAPEDFFVDDKLNVFFEQGLSPSGQPIDGETAYRKAWRNTNAFLDLHFKIERRHRLCHTPFALRKSYIEQFEQQFPEIFAGNSCHRFRSEQDFNVTNGLLQYYWSYHDKIVSRPLTSRPVSSMMISFRTDDALHRTIEQLEVLKNNWPVTFCLQDLMDEKSVQAQALLHEFLERNYPDPAPWEK